MKQPVYGIYGASGYGREVMPLARSQLRAKGIALERLVFIDDSASDTFANGHSILTYQQFIDFSATEHFVAIAIGNSIVREKLFSQCRTDHLQPWDICASNVSVLDQVTIGPGAILNPFVTLTSNIRIGKQFHANIYSYVAHDCLIGDYVTFAPSVKCNGNIIIEDHAYIGAGAILKQGKPDEPLIIGRGAVVGMGAVVTKNVPAGITVVGNPAKPLVKK